MRCFRIILLLLLTGPAWALEGYIVGVGAEADSADAATGAVSGEIGLTKKTWLSAAMAKSTADLPRGVNLETLYGDIGIDHYFGPLGIRAGVSYWGDDEILDSRDYLASLYWRSDKAMIAAEFEHRDFSFDVFRGDLRPGQDIQFQATGVGLSARFDLTESVDLRVSGIDYDYDVNLRIDANRPILDYLSVSRLSLINSLSDYRARIGLGIDVGERRWSLDLQTSVGEVDGRRTKSATLRFLTPIGSKSDIELGLGFDDAESYGSVTLFSIFLYFYG